MPYAMPHLCNATGCGERVRTRFCDEHTSASRKYSDSNRQGHNKKYNTKEWKETRQQQLDAFPFCQMILKDKRSCNAIAKHVDHIIAVVDGGSDDGSNLQSLCHSCHSRKTVKHDGGFGKRKVAS